jgi:ribosomal protein L11 methyltransferase
MASATDARWLAARVKPSNSIASVGGESAPIQSLIDALIAHGSNGVHEDSGSLVAYYRSESLDEATLRRALAIADERAELDIQPVDDADWARRWQSGIGAHRIGRLTVMPPWLAERADDGSTIVIDPGMGFGTGEHPTTRCSLELLSQVVRPGDLVVDAGTGSGVLAIAAAKLGARWIAAIEIDADAIGNAEHNVALNSVGDRVRVIEGDAALLLPILAPVDLIVANIISSVGAEMLPTMASALAPAGRVVVSGILVEEQKPMADFLTTNGWNIRDELLEEEWWTALVERR